MDLIVPCAGRSSRYPGSLPKYLWPIDGMTMLEVATGCVAHLADRVFLAVLEEHDRKWQVQNTIFKAFDHMSVGVMVLPEVTDGQADTVRQILHHFKIDGPFFVKDSDSAFWVTGNTLSMVKNGVCCCSVADYPHLLNLDAKSYAQINDQGLLVGVAEKQVVSGQFGCGGYLFDDPDEFYRAYEDLGSSQELYLSYVVEIMLSQGVIFHPIPCHGYRDYGTFESWEWTIHQRLLED